MLAAAQACVQHLAGLGAGRHQRVIAQLAGVPVGGAGFGLAGNLTDRRVHIDGHRRLAGTAPGAPRPGQDLPCGLVQPPDMTPDQRAQESPHRGRRRRGEPQHRPRRARPQPVQVIDMRPPDRHRRHQRRHLPPRRRRPGAPAPTHLPAHTQAAHQRPRRQQARISHQRPLVEDHLEPINAVRYPTHRKCLLIRANSRFQLRPFSQVKEAPPRNSTPNTTNPPVDPGLALSTASGICPVADSRTARRWPTDLPGVQLVSGVTPFPAVAWVRRMLSPVSGGRSPPAAPRRTVVRTTP